MTSSTKNVQLFKQGGSAATNPKRIIVQRKRGTFAVIVQSTWFLAVLKHPYEVVLRLRETSESVIVFKMHLTGQLQLVRGKAPKF